MTIPHTAPESVPVDGPRWAPGVAPGDTQIDGRGVCWIVERVEPGGRVVRWAAVRRLGGFRVARTEVTPAHPSYPSDADVLAAQRADRRRRARDLQ